MPTTTRRPRIAAPKTPAPRPAPPIGACEVCGGFHEVTAEDRIGDRGERVSDAEAMMVAHFRLAILATSAQPFRLHGGRAR